MMGDTSEKGSTKSPDALPKVAFTTKRQAKRKRLTSSCETGETPKSAGACAHSRSQEIR